MKALIIAVDGHASCGKSSLAKFLAQHFKYRYIDTGAMYRAVTLFATEKQIADSKGIDETALRNSIKNGKIRIDFKYLQEQSQIMLNGKKAEPQIREARVSEMVSKIARLDFVRDFLVKQQQSYGTDGAVVMDGRDIGTVVFPNADVKIFLTADINVRAQRRYSELKEKNIAADFEKIKQNLIERDKIDSERKHSPLRKAEDAILLDNSELSRKETLEKAIEICLKAADKK